MFDVCLRRRIRVVSKDGGDETFREDVIAAHGDRRPFSCYHYAGDTKNVFYRLRFSRADIVCCVLLSTVYQLVVALSCAYSFEWAICCKIKKFFIAVRAKFSRRTVTPAAAAAPAAGVSVPETAGVDARRTNYFGAYDTDPTAGGTRRNFGRFTSDSCASTGGGRDGGEGMRSTLAVNFEKPPPVYDAALAMKKPSVGDVVYFTVDGQEGLVCTFRMSADGDDDSPPPMYLSATSVAAVPTSAAAPASVSLVDEEPAETFV